MTNIKFPMSNESPNKGKKYNIYDRALEFASRVAIFAIALPKNQASIEYGKQVIRSSAAIGANIEEADGTLSRKDFVNRFSIGRREASETVYWLRLIERTGLTKDCDANDIASLINESRELLLILSSIINKTRERNRI